MQRKPLFTDRPAKQRSCAKRCATTLVELLVVTTLVSILLAVVGTLAIRLRQWDRHVRDHSQHNSQSTSLAAAIRADIRRATGVTRPEKNVVAIAGPDGREIRYELHTDGCRRMSKSSGEKSDRIEQFAIGPADFWIVETANPGRRTAYTISLARPDADKATSQPVPFFVYAAVGSDLP
jgi:hypothetical protein